MNISTQLDPFHLVSLSEDIDLQCQRLVARELPKAVDEKVLYKLKVDLREQMVSLLAEMISEWRHLAQDTGEASIFDENWIIPGVPEMAAQLPWVYGACPQEGSNKRAWHVERVRWTISTWLQLWGQLFAYLPSAELPGSGLDPDSATTATENFVATEVEPLLSRVPKASEILAITRIANPPASARSA